MSERPKLLVTTALERTWGTDEPIVFLGEWCMLYYRREVWGLRSHEVVPNHWDDRRKLRMDHDSLNDLHERILASLAAALGVLHGIDRPLQYWRLILDPWLLTYVAIVWDRWESLRIAFELHPSLETIATRELPRTSPLDYNAFTDCMQSDEWNYSLMLDILRAGKLGPLKIRPASPTIANAEQCGQQPQKTAVESGKEKRARLLDALLAKLPSSNRMVMFNPYFPRSEAARLYLRLGQPPRTYLSELAWPMSSMKLSGVSEPALRGRLDLGFEARNDFEEFVTAILAHDLPESHVENFSPILQRAREIKLRPRAILTATAHWGNELFKVWSAERVNGGAKLVTMEHGGCFPPAMSAMSFDENVAEVRTTWATAFHPKHRRLPANKLIGQKQIQPGRHLGIVGLEMPRYNFRAEAAPKAGQILSSFHMACEMFAELSPEIQAETRVKPGPNLGWNTRQRFADALGPGRVAAEQGYRSFLSSTRLVVCTYPQTTFSESVAWGLPSILLYPKELWETMPQFDEVLEILRAAKIVFHDPAAAAAHVNDVWRDPAGWWQSEAVLAARKAFSDTLLDTSPNWLEQWSTFIESVVA